jgi:hypothetical protein
LGYTTRVAVSISHKMIPSPESGIGVRFCLN